MTGDAIFSVHEDRLVRSEPEEYDFEDVQDLGNAGVVVVATFFTGRVWRQPLLPE